MEVVWTNIDEVNRKVTGFANSTDRAAKRFVAQALALLEKLIKKKAAGTRHRKKVSASGRAWYPPSEHIGGDGPDFRSGLLVRGVHSIGPIHMGSSGYVGYVGPSAVYAPALEDGAKGGSHKIGAHQRRNTVRRLGRHTTKAGNTRYTESAKAFTARARTAGLNTHTVSEHMQTRTRGAGRYPFMAPAFTEASPALKLLAARIFAEAVKTP